MKKIERMNEDIESDFKLCLIAQFKLGFGWSV